MKISKIFNKIKIFKKPNLNNSVILHLSGYNLERYLNSLCNKNVKILSVEKINYKNSKIEIHTFNELEVEEFLKSKGIDVAKKEYNGFAKIQKFFFTRCGVLIGLFFLFCIYVVASNYIMDIKVLGSENVSDQDIVAVLNDNGIKFFNPLNIKSNEEIKKIIMDNFDEISMVSVIKKGNTILINIKEKLLNDEHEKIGEYASLIATNDGIITHIELIQGTLLVKIGDMVKTGDCLVAPYVKDSSGEKISIEPRANVYADVWLSGESSHNEVRKIAENTGRQLTKRVVTFLNQVIYQNDIEVPFKEYEMEIIENYLSSFIIPIKYKIIKYYEIETKLFEQNFSEVELLKINEAKDLAYLRISNGEEIKSENYVISSKYGITTVSYSITVNRKIS